MHWSATRCTFQFQTGAIKRLRHHLIEAEKRRFQFQTGAIKSGTANVQGSPSASVFQFQTGAIKRNMWMRSLGISMRNFNSKLVRLKVVTPRKAVHPSNFNSKLVRLKDNVSYLYPDGADFNSKLVRLKDHRRRL